MVLIQPSYFIIIEKRGKRKGICKKNTGRRVYREIRYCLCGLWITGLWITAVFGLFSWVCPQGQRGPDKHPEVQKGYKINTMRNI